MLENMTEEARQRIQRDPFLILGLGMYGLRSFLVMLIALFTVLTILSLPIIYIYSTGSGYSRNLQDNNWFLVKISIGNMFLDGEATQEEQSEQYDKLTVVAQLSMYISIVFFLTIKTNKDIFKLSAEVFDRDTVTLADYSFELELSKSQIDNFYYCYFDDSKDSSFALAMYSYLKTEISNQLTFSLNNELKRSETSHKLSVAHLQLNFKQSKLINLLKERGSKITDGSKAAIDEANSKIRALMNTEVYQKEMCEIISAYVIF